MPEGCDEDNHPDHVELSIRKRLDVLPFDEAVHRDLLATLAACGRFAEGEAHLDAATHLFRAKD
jgi:hypothetical protein